MLSCGKEGRWCGGCVSCRASSHVERACATDHKSTVNSAQVQLQTCGERVQPRMQVWHVREFEMRAAGSGLRAVGAVSCARTLHLNCTAVPPFREQILRATHDVEHVVDHAAGGDRANPNQTNQMNSRRRAHDESMHHRTPSHCSAARLKSRIMPLSFLAH